MSHWRSIRWILSIGRRPIFDEIELAYRRFARILGFETITAIPLSRARRSQCRRAGYDAMPWYEGPSLLAVARDRAGSTNA